MLPARRRGCCALLRQARARRGALHHASLAWRWLSSSGRSLPADGTIGLVERIAWAPSLGIEYHLGVDGLGALMLVLSAIVTLMSVDAAHRVHHQPGLYFALVLAARVRPLRLVHRAEFLPLVFVLGAEPDSRLLPHQAVGRSAARPGGDAVLRLHHGRLAWRCWSRFSPSFSPPSNPHGLRRTSPLLASTGELEQMVTAHLGPGDALAGHRRAGRLRRQGADGSLPHLAARGLR